MQLTDKPRIGDRTVSKEQVTIVILDDEPSILKVVCRVLRPLGYRLLQAEVPTEAFEHQNASPEGVDLLLSDVTMPGTSGFEVLETMRRKQPKLPAIFMTGLPLEAITEHPPNSAFVLKPFTHQDLVGAISKALGEVG